MPMIKCPTCGSPVSSFVSACPECGRRISEDPIAQARADGVLESSDQQETEPDKKKSSMSLIGLVMLIVGLGAFVATLHSFGVISPKDRRPISEQEKAMVLQDVKHLNSIGLINRIEETEGVVYVNQDRWAGLLKDGRGRVTETLAKYMRLLGADRIAVTILNEQGQKLATYGAFGYKDLTR